MGQKKVSLFLISEVEMHACVVQYILYLGWEKVSCLERGVLNSVQLTCTTIVLQASQLLQGVIQTAWVSVNGDSWLLLLLLLLLLNTLQQTDHCRVL